MILERFDEIRTSLAFFTRLPVLLGGYWSAPLRQNPTSALTARLFANSFWAAPISGLVIGLATLLVCWFASLMGLSVLMPVLALTIPAALTGGLHEDGLADLADACGGSTRQRRLDIMKDSTIGSFGATALVLWFLAAYVVLEYLLDALAFTWLFATSLCLAAMASRGCLPIAIHWLPTARNNGLGQSAKSTPLMGAWIALAISVSLTLVLGFWLPLLLLLLGQLATYGFAWRLLGGATGDVFGAAQKIGVLCFFIGVAAAITP